MRKTLEIQLSSKLLSWNSCLIRQRYVIARQTLIIHSLVASQQQIELDKIDLAVGKWISVESAPTYSDVMLLKGRDEDKRASPCLPPPINTNGLCSAVSVKRWSASFVRSSLHI